MNLLPITTLDMSTALSLLAQAEQAPQGNMLVGMMPMILLFAGFWFLIIAPQRKKQKEHQKMINELKSGEEIITSGGIYGTITNVKDDRFVVKIADGTKIEITKSSIGSVVSAESK